MGKRLYLVLALLACMIFSVQVLASDARPNADGCVGECTVSEAIQNIIPDAATNKCFTLKNPDYPEVAWEIKVKKSGKNITGGQITGTICESPWTVTGGKMTAKSITINASHDGTGCANTLVITGKKGKKKSYSGTYYWDGNTSNSYSFTAKSHACN